MEHRGSESPGKETMSLIDNGISRRRLKCLERESSARPATHGLLHSWKKTFILAAALAITACSHEYVGDGEVAKAVRRYDVVQALAANGKVAVAGTQNGALLVSGDEGRSWSRQMLGPVSLIDLAVCPDGSFVGIDFNHKVWSGGADGGVWQASALEKSQVPLAVDCDSLGRWHVAGSRAKIARSTDRGASWEITDLDEDAQITAVQMIDERHGVALGEFGLFAVTEDGGATWQPGPRLPGEFYPYAALFTSREEGYASGLAGTVLRTRDGGVSWQQIGNDSTAALYRLFMHDGRPYGVGAGGVVARLVGDGFAALPYADAVPVFLGAGASLPGRAVILVGGPGGLVRPVGTHVN